MTQVGKVLILGCGYAGTAVARLARSRGEDVLPIVRSQEGAERLRGEGFECLRRPRLDHEVGDLVTADTHAVVAFPPDGRSDASLAPALAGARAVTYISSTGVYAADAGDVNDTTPVDPHPDERAARRLRAEEAYRAVGATILRCPAIYGPDRGVHVRIARGEHEIPGDGSKVVSRIHVEDLAALVLASAAVRGEVFVVGDLAPVPHIEVVRHVCQTFGRPMPDRAPAGSVHATLRADRRVDGSRALARLGVRLKYPTFREGMTRAP